MIKFDLPMEEYLALDAVSSSSLKHILRSPKDYKANLAKKSEETEAQAFGTAVHFALEHINQPERFYAKYALEDRNKIWGVKTKNEENGGCKREWEAYKKQHEGKIFLNAKDSDRLLETIEAVKFHKGAMTIFSSGNAEVTAVMEEDGIKYKARTDWLRKVSDNHYEIWDIKTTSGEMDDESLRKEVYQWGYHFQAAFHCDVFANFLPIREFGWIFISTKTPAVHVVTRNISEKLIRQGREDLLNATTLLTDCLNSDEWPGFDDEIKLLSGWR